MLRDFYGDFEENLKKAEKDLEGVYIKVPDEVSEEICPVCGRNLVVKSGRFGRFLACPGFPECNFTMPLVVEMPGRCPKCGGRLMKRTGVSKKTGKQYALKAWNKIKPTAELHERIMQAVDAQKRSDQWRRENGRYIPNPSTWLNGGYWDNEEVNEGAENQRDPEQPDSSGRDWGKGFKPADDE